MITHKSISDERGTLYPLSLTEIPFEVKRVFFVTDVPLDSARGGHAHITCLQYYLCIKGKILIKCQSGQEQYLRQGQGMFIDKNVFTTEYFSSTKDVLMVFCSHEYDPNDYIK